MPTHDRHRRSQRTGAIVAAIVSVLGLTTVWARQQPTFRSVVDLIAVDVQVVGSDGTPIERLDPGAFDVAIEGHRRKVVSAQFIRQDGAADHVVSASDAVPPPPEGRIFIIAVDNGSFNAGTTTRPMEEIRAFLGRLQPTDRVGLSVFPTGGWIAPTLLRAPLRVALDHVYGERQTLQSQYNLSPWEIVDITAETSVPRSFATSLTGRTTAAPAAVVEPLDTIAKIQRRECPDDAQCPKRIYAEGMELGVQLEQQTQASLAGLRTLFRGLAGIPGRKYVVLISAGVLVSDRLDGRPDVSGAAAVMGQEAAQAQALLYTVQLDLSSASPDAASKRGSANSEQGRDRAMFGNWLDDFSRSAGGTRIYVPVGDGAFAFDRVLRESSAYYLLGVEPAEADRDGRPRQLHVNVGRRGTTVRSRQWVVIPRRGK